MKIDQPYACDVCQIQKKEANHWWKAFLLKPGRETEASVSVLVVPWETDVAYGPAPKFEAIAPLPVNEANAHLCGEECAMKYISKNLFQTQS